MTTNHHNDALTPNSSGVNGMSRNANDATAATKTAVINEIISEGKVFGLSNQDIANLIAIAKVESGFNPDAAARSLNSTKYETSASGVFQITDSTAADAASRLSNSKIDKNIDLGTYNRFDYKSNIRYGIAIYLDKKRIAAATGAADIYKAWNTNPAEYNRYLTQLTNDSASYLNQVNANTAAPGPVEQTNTDTFNGDIVYIYSPDGYTRQSVQTFMNDITKPITDTQTINEVLGRLQNEMVATQNADGTVTANYSGTGGNFAIDNATITTAAGSQLTVTGTRDTVNAGTGSNITIGGNGRDAGTAEIVNGSGSTTNVEDNSSVTVNGDSAAVIQGNSSTVSTSGASDSVTVNGNNNDTNTTGSGTNVEVDGNYNQTENWGTGTHTVNWGDYDQTKNWGSNQSNVNNGLYDSSWGANSSDSNWNSDPTDSGGGSETGGGYYGDDDDLIGGSATSATKPAHPQQTTPSNALAQPAAHATAAMLTAPLPSAYQADLVDSLNPSTFAPAYFEAGTASTQAQAQSLVASAGTVSQSASLIQAMSAFGADHGVDTGHLLPVTSDTHLLFGRPLSR